MSPKAELQVYGTPDDENPEWTTEEIRTARPIAEVLPELAAAARRGRGPQKAPRKQMVSLRLDAEVLARFRATGKGWHSRINDTLAAHAPRARRARPAARATKKTRRASR
jgi:uncharacterized protein (DUF4415 family)